MPIAPVIMIDDDLPEAPNAPLIDDMEAANQWAIVVYQPPIIRHVAALLAVPYGPPLPPEMVWRRTFENLLQAPAIIAVPTPILLQSLSPVVLSKRI